MCIRDRRDLANFLNITDVALSRIAKRVRNEVSADETTDLGTADSTELGPTAVG
jgi:hypothetical protein